MLFDGDVLRQQESTTYDLLGDEWFSARCAEPLSDLGKDRKLRFADIYSRTPVISHFTPGLNVELGSCNLPTTRHRPGPDRYHPSRADEPLKSFTVLAFEDLMLVDDRLVERGTLPWLLREHAGLIFPDWLVDGWRGGTRRGREAWPAPLLFGTEPGGRGTAGEHGRGVARGAPGALGEQPA